LKGGHASRVRQNTVHRTEAGPGEGRGGEQEAAYRNQEKSAGEVLNALRSKSLKDRTMTPKLSLLSVNRPKKRSKLPVGGGGGGLKKVRGKTPKKSTPKRDQVGVQTQRKKLGERKNQTRKILTSATAFGVRMSSAVSR